MVLNEALSLTPAANSSWQASPDTSGKSFITVSVEGNNGTLAVSALKIKSSASTDYIELSSDYQVIYQSNTRGNNQA